MQQLSQETVRQLLLAQGYEVPAADLQEITARLNALTEELTNLDGRGLQKYEPWAAPIWIDRFDE